MDRWPRRQWDDAEGRGPHTTQLILNIHTNELHRRFQRDGDTGQTGIDST